MPRIVKRRPGDEAVDTLVFQLRAARLPEPVREHRFHEERKWRFDLAWPDRLVAIEVDGGAFVAGRHVRGAGIRADSEKFSEAAALGWRVLRALPEHVDSGQALRWIERALNWRSTRVTIGVSATTETTVAA